MKKKTVKILSVVLAALMFLSVFSVLLSVFAAPAPQEETSSPEVTVSQDVQTENNAVTENVEKETNITEENVLPENKTEQVTEEVATTNVVPAKSETVVNMPMPMGFTRVVVNTAENVGPFTLIFKNKETKEDYTVDLTYKDGVYEGNIQMPVGTYKIEQLKKDKDNTTAMKIKLAESGINFQNPNENIELNIEKARHDLFAGFFKNNIVTFLLLIATLTFYAIYKKKNSITDDQKR